MSNEIIIREWTETQPPELNAQVELALVGVTEEEAVEIVREYDKRERL